MEILLISYGDIDFDGRLRSLISVFSQIGNTHSFTRGVGPLNKNSQVSKSSYIRFIGEAVHFAKELERIDWLVLDNRKATIPGMIIQRLFKPKATIQDCRELYLINEVKHLSGKIGCVFERLMVRKVDAVICANQDRARIMQQEYKLIYQPLTYENLRQLSYGSADEVKAAKSKIDKYFHDGEYRIVSSSGCSVKRTNDVLVRNLPKVKEPVRLFLVGDSSSEDVAIIRRIIDENKMSNVEILGQLNQTELKYLISQSHIGIVNYGQYDTNNKLCASGKIYEFIYEGIPVVTTTNPPLLRMCAEYCVGEADDEYFRGINKVISDYIGYKNRVDLFAKNHSIDDNDQCLISQINSILST